MLILKAVLLGMSLFIISVLIYMFAAPKLIGNGNVSLDSPFLWLAFAASLAVGYVIASRGLWIIEGLLLGGGLFIVGVLGCGIAYNRILNASSPPTAVGIDVPHLWSWLFAALICSLGLGLAIARIWPPPRGVAVR